jgi:hypothetical protein
VPLFEGGGEPRERVGPGARRVGEPPGPRPHPRWIVELERRFL